MLRACIACLLLVSSLVATVHAQDSDVGAHALFIAGEAAYGEGRYAAALEHFQRAYELSGRALLLYNIGSSAEHLRRDAARARRGCLTPHWRHRL